MRNLSALHGLVPGPFSIVLIVFTSVSFAGYTNSGLENIVISTDLGATLIDKEDEIENSIIGFLVSPAPVPTTIPEPNEQSDDPPQEPESGNSDTILATTETETDTTTIDIKPEAASPEPEVSSEAPPAQPDEGNDEKVASAEAAPEATSAAMTDAIVPQEENPEDTIRININKTIQGWAFAWSNQDVTGYLGFYADEFTPDNPKLSRSTWAAQRKDRLLKPEKIELGLSNVAIYLDEAPLKRAEFEQTYKSDVYQDKVLKSLEFIDQDGEWKIRSERTIKVLQ